MIQNITVLKKCLVELSQNIWHSIQKAVKVGILFAEASLTKMEKECESVLQEIRADIQELLIVFWKFANLFN